jgi:hypothetical protein
MVDYPYIIVESILKLENAQILRRTVKYLVMVVTLSIQKSHCYLNCLYIKPVMEVYKRSGSLLI